MSKIYFSPKTLGFYQETFKAEYLKTNSWPDDLIEISKQDYNYFALTPITSGKSLIFRDNTLKLVDFKPSPEDLGSAEIKWVGSELTRIRDELEKVQDSDTNAIGSVSQWRDYRKYVRAWPEHADFPKIEFRPKAPDANKE